MEDFVVVLCTFLERGFMSKAPRHEAQNKGPVEAVGEPRRYVARRISKGAVQDPTSEQRQISTSFLLVVLQDYTSIAQRGHPRLPTPGVPKSITCAYSLNDMTHHHTEKGTHGFSRQQNANCFRAEYPQSRLKIHGIGAEGSCYACLQTRRQAQGNGTRAGSMHFRTSDGYLDPTQLQSSSVYLRNIVKGRRTFQM